MTEDQLLLAIDQPLLFTVIVRHASHNLLEITGFDSIPLAIAFAESLIADGMTQRDLLITVLNEENPEKVYWAYWDGVVAPTSEGATQVVRVFNLNHKEDICLSPADALLAAK